jgi:hypothetical protein
MPGAAGGGGGGAIAGIVGAGGGMPGIAGVDGKPVARFDPGGSGVRDTVGPESGALDWIEAPEEP